MSLAEERKNALFPANSKVFAACLFIRQWLLAYGHAYCSEAGFWGLANFNVLGCGRRLLLRALHCSPPFADAAAGGCEEVLPSGCASRAPGERIRWGEWEVADRFCGSQRRLVSKLSRADATA